MGSWDGFLVLGSFKIPSERFEVPSSEKNFGGLLGGSGSMFPRKSLKLEPLRLAENAYSCLRGGFRQN